MTSCALARVFVCVRLGDSFLLLIDRHEKEVFGENVHMARPRPHPLVPRVTIAKKNQEKINFLSYCEK